MNILFFSRLFYPHIGGVEKHLLEISKILIEKGHRVAVFTEQFDSKLKLHDSIEKIEIYRISVGKDNFFKKFRIWRKLLKYRKIIKNADVIHAHDVFFWYLPFRFLYFKKPIFTTFHGYESYPLKSKEYLMHKISEKLSMGNICVGDFIKKWYGTKPTYVTYGGVNEMKNARLAARQEKLKMKNENSAVFIGRLDEQTGIITYVRAIEIIKKKIPDFDFLVIGDGELKDRITKKIKILKPFNKAAEYFRNYNFAFVSRYLSILEALTAKRLVFSVYDNPLKEDYLRLSPFSKYITISNSSSELVSKISFYLDNLKEKEKKIEAGYTWVTKHTWEEVANTYLKLWKTKS